MKKETFISAGKIICLIFSLVFINVAVQAQSPAANISGPLKAYVSGEDISLTSEIVTDNANPTILYSFDRNTSGASIVSQGTLVYDRSTRTGKQTIVINPGSAKGSFNIRLLVTDRNGTCESSKSVTVVNSRGSIGYPANNSNN